MSSGKKLEKVKEQTHQIAVVGKQRFSLTLTFAIIVFLVIVSAVGLASLAIYIFSLVGWTGGFEDEISVGAFVGYVAIISVIIGGTISLLLALFPLRPVNDLINHMNSLASGNFKTRLKFRGIFAEHPAFMEISSSFDKLANELESTELLRSDFINNFSHEFKTPIVSIAGLAKLLCRADIPEQKRKEYLAAIEEESRRLAALSTNTLLLSKVEKQTILTDISEYNLSEQIRSSVLLLENKWSEKDIEPSLNFDEYTVIANEELMREVWINLIDNAVKFSPQNSKITIDIKEMESFICVSLQNEGNINENDRNKIFNKFYRTDASHTTEGSGIGLAIVKKILDLHGFSVSLSCGADTVTFSVMIPKH